MGIYHTKKGVCCSVWDIRDTRSLYHANILVLVLLIYPSYSLVFSSAKKLSVRLQDRQQRLPRRERTFFSQNCHDKSPRRSITLLWKRWMTCLIPNPSRMITQPPSSLCLKNILSRHRQDPGSLRCPQVGKGRLNRVAYPLSAE